MIYDEPIYRPLGDCMLGVEFGDEANLELNFKVLELERLVNEAGIPGVIETVPSLRELVLVIDGTTIPGAAESICVHGDGPTAVEIVDRVVAMLAESDHPLRAATAKESEDALR